jgi:hypothetical protein
LSNILFLHFLQLPETRTKNKCGMKYLQYMGGGGCSLVSLLEFISASAGWLPQSKTCC